MQTSTGSNTKGERRSTGAPNHSSKSSTRVLTEPDVHVAEASVRRQDPGGILRLPRNLVFIPVESLRPVANDTAPVRGARCHALQSPVKALLLQHSALSVEFGFRRRTGSVLRQQISVHVLAIAGHNIELVRPADVADATEETIVSDITWQASDTQNGVQ
ncbi:hypothetical protein PGQ11_002885 [Apiospora arundinis]|uniref:Uncharacterized protein n=1 Tax=Apiospora arundinis TaxID=335852 RepID=A0ABR2J3H2_9PEZI